MSLKSFFAKQYAKRLVKRQYREAKQAVDCQQRVFQQLIKKARRTKFGVDHKFSELKHISDFQQAVPIRDYELAKPYFDRIVEGETNILWPGKPLYFAKTSGTTSGTKYIPITKDSISNHMNGAKMALLNMIYHRKNSDFVTGKMIFLSGSPILSDTSGVLTGRLSGIVNHHIPSYLKSNQVPSWQTNCIDDWEQKVDAIVEETKSLNMTLISGIPPWVIMYFERLLEQTGKNSVQSVFPNFDLFVYGGVNYKPYASKIDQLIGGSVQMLETYPASEGFIAYQDLPTNEGLLLNINSGIFYEFVPADEIFNEQPTRLTLDQVQLDTNYAIILTTNAGLWAYNIGDTIKFVSKDPYRIVVTGRTKHFISAFGEHVIAEEVEKALGAGIVAQGGVVSDFHVAPRIEVEGELPYHEWFVAFDELPHNISAFSKIVDQEMMKLNSYYRDLRVGQMLQQLKVRTLPPSAFQDYMKSIGKLGGQNKLPRLANNRAIADQLEYTNLN